MGDEEESVDRDALCTRVVETKHGHKITISAHIPMTSKT